MHAYKIWIYHSTVFAVQIKTYLQQIACIWGQYQYRRSYRLGNNLSTSLTKHHLLHQLLEPLFYTGITLLLKSNNVYTETQLNS